MNLSRMNRSLFSNLPIPPALVYLLHQLREHGIDYSLYGEVPNSDMVFVDIDRAVAKSLTQTGMPVDWEIINPHFLSQRALEVGEPDPISNDEVEPEAVVIAFGGHEAKTSENFQALCEQVQFLRTHPPSRLVYRSSTPPEPMEIQALIQMLKAGLLQ